MSKLTRMTSHRAVVVSYEALTSTLGTIEWWRETIERWRVERNYRVVEGGEKL